MYLLGILVWVAVVATLARLVTARIKNSALRVSLVVLAVPFSFVLALADEIVGRYQFERLCEEAKEVKIYATHPVGEELYMPDGEWRRDHIEKLRRNGQVGGTREDSDRLQSMYESLVRYVAEPTVPEALPAAIVIRRYHYKIYDKSDGRLLAEFDQYGTSGGWVSQNFEVPFLVRPQCEPPLFAIHPAPVWVTAAGYRLRPPQWK
jgi:hypothetical protein